MAAKLSDVELRRKLKDLGVDVGPVTDSTRKLLQKKLDQLTASNVPAKDRRRSAPPRAATTVQAAKIQPSLLEYSSEDSEIDNSSWDGGSQGSRRRDRRRTLPPRQLQVSISKDLISRPIGLTSDDAVFKVPTPISTPGRVTRSSGASSNISQESVDPSLTRPKLRSASRRSLQSTSYDIDSSDSDVDFESRRRSGRPATRLSSQIASKFVEPETKNSNENGEASNVATTASSWFSFRSRSTPTSPKFTQNNIEDHEHEVKLNGGQFDDSSFEGEFQIAEDPHSTANNSHLVSMFLLCLITAFFVVVGMLYVGVKHDGYISTASLENYTEMICKGFNDDDCIQKEDLPFALKTARSLHAILSAAAGEHECTPDKRSTRWVSMEDVQLELQSIHPELRVASEMEKVLQNCLLLIKFRPEWGISSLRSDASQRVRAFEASNPRKSIYCRLKLAIQAVFLKLVVAFAVILLSLVVFLFGKRYRKRKKIHQLNVYVMVDKIIDVLRNHGESNEEKDSANSSVPIIHVRDMLIPPAERKEKQKLWDEAVQFLKENESRVLMERKRLAGEEFLAWRWFQQASPTDSKKSKVWQGQAFENSGRGVNVLPYSPTPCLKIRNMFDPAMEFGDSWHVSIQDALLEKCQGNHGIVHIAVDTKSEEGCVYIKLKSAEAAGRAYRSLHGWWFDGKLLTVKYLRLERYLERFPESANCTSPLKASSNNMQLFLQPGESSSSSLLDSSSS